MDCIDFKKAFDTVSKDFLFRTLSVLVLEHLLFDGSTLFRRTSGVVLNNGFAVSNWSFAVERGVRQGDPLSAYLFIIALEVLCVNIRNSNDIRGIKVDNEEIKVSLLAHDLTVFLKDDLSLTNFLKLIEGYGTCSGLKVNHEKTELLLLGNLACTARNWQMINRVDGKQSFCIIWNLLVVNWFEEIAYQITSLLWRMLKLFCKVLEGK